MQFALTLAALAATASASFAVRDDNPDDQANGMVKVVNRCPYDVYLWSIDKQVGCGSDAAIKLSTGDDWSQQMQNSTNGGISVKLSKWNQCGGKDQTQLEYKIERYTAEQTAANPYLKSGNFLDMSFVDCQGGDCPGWHDGFYMASGKSGNSKIIQASAVDNEHCPVFSVANAVQAAKVSYVLPDDRQTKFCNFQANLDLYLCGSEAPGAEDETPSSSSSAAPSSSKTPAPSQAKPTTLQVIPSKPASSADSADAGAVKAAAVTSAPAAPAAQPPKAVKTVITYVTVSVDAPMHKRHAHGRRHNRA